MNVNKAAINSQLALLHDAELRGITHSRDQKLLDFLFWKSDALPATLSLSGVAAFRCTDFGLQNVVSRLLVHGINIELSASEIHARIAWISETSDGEQLEEKERIESRVKQVLSGKFLLVQLESSWGAEFAALSIDMRI